MTDFTAFNASTHPIVRLENDWNNLLAHGLEKDAYFIVRVNGSYIEAITGGTSSGAGTIAYGGADNAGATSGTDVQAVIQAALTNLPATVPSKVAVKGDFTLNAKLSLTGYEILDLSQAKITAASGLDDNMIEATGYYWSIIGGYLDHDKANQASGSVIRVLAGSQRFWIGGGMRIFNADDYGIHLEGTGASPNDIGVGTIHDVTVEDSDSHGVYSGPWSYDHIFSRINVGGNGGSGICLSSSTSNLIDTCLAWNNTSHGFDIYTSDDNSLINFRADQNTEKGVRLYGSDDCVVFGKAYSNGSSGLGLENGCIDNQLSGDYVLNGEHGVVVSACGHNTLNALHCLSNQYHGLSIYSSPDVSVSGGEFLNNSQDGAGTYDGIQLGNNAVTFSTSCVITGTRCHDTQGVKTQRYGIINISALDDYLVINGNQCRGNLTGPYGMAGPHNAYDGKMRTAVSADLSGGAVTLVVGQAEEPLWLARATLLYTEASSADAGITLEIGKGNGAVDRNYYYTGASVINQAIWTNTQLTLLQNDVAAGDTITFYSPGGKAGTGEVMVILDYLVGAD